MEQKPQIKCLFLDIGGVLLTDGWNRHARKRAVERFDLDHAEMEERHDLIFAVYEEGKLSLEEYLNRTVFYKQRSFSRDKFREFMFAQSAADVEMIDLVRGLKGSYRLKTIVVSNEARELNAYRIRKFGLAEFIDAFVSSCFVGTRKPDPSIYRFALDIAQTPAEQIVYLENTAMFVDVADSFGINSIHHLDYGSTRVKLEAFGLTNDHDKMSA
ncbi:MAG: HAD hydrolase-like protein [Acidobacteria bacterium]|nr:HAD hydrolase-like protein [Acidobacteriota bacterium]